MNRKIKRGAGILLASLLVAFTLGSCNGNEKNLPADETSGDSSALESIESFDNTDEAERDDAVANVANSVDADADEVDGIAIRSADDLMKIGKSDDYPMDGDYVLVADLDLSGIENFTPIGGAASECGIVEGKNVFSGTFDGRGHTIAGLSIQVSSVERVHVGLFGSVGSAKEDDPAEIRNLIMKEINVTGVAKGSSTYAALAGQVDGYVKIDNIALLSGKVTVENESGDVLGVGSLIGQCRTQTWTGCSNTGIHITNIFANVDVTGDNDGYSARTGGLIGRIRATQLGTLSNVVQIGNVVHEGRQGYAIAGGDCGALVCENVYYLKGVGKSNNGLGSAKVYASLTNGKQTLDADYWRVTENELPLLNSVYNSPTFSLLDFVTLTLANGETATTVKSSFTLTDSIMNHSIQWESSDVNVVSINGTAATVVRPDLGSADVTLTARIDGASKTFSLRVLSGVKGKLVKDTENNALIAGNYPDDVSFQWVVTNAATGKTVKTTSSDDGTLTLTSSMNNCLITLKVDGYDDIVYYNSSIPTICINSDVGYYELNKGSYSTATMTVYTSEKYPSTRYDNDIQIKLRGNSTAYASKRPFRLKLAKKTDMFDMGESKHWVLLANAYDRSNLRNKLSYDFGMSLGLAGCESVLVNVIYNGEYYGMYQFCENIRIAKDRVNIYNWEDTAEDVAKAIAKEAGLSSDAKDALIEAMQQDLSWITSGKFGDYVISDYYDTSEFNITGGYLIENDYYYDEYSKFTTTNDMRLMVQKPEYLATNSEMMSYLQNYIQDMEDAMYSPNRLNDDGKHYSEYMDVDSFLDFFMVNQLFKNVELFYKSCYMYKDVDGLLTFGPIWDMDWAAGNHVNLGGTSAAYDVWAHDQSQDREFWYRALYSDPWFIVLLCEHWEAIQENVDAMMTELETLSKEVNAEAEVDNARWGYDWSFKKEVSSLKYWLIDRRNWMNDQMKDPETLIRSFDYYKDSKKIGITSLYEGSDFLELTLTVRDEEKFKSCDLLINGVVVREVEIADGCKIRIEKSELREAGKYNSIEILGKTADGSYNVLQKRGGQRGSAVVDSDFVYYLSK